MNHASWALLLKVKLHLVELLCRLSETHSKGTLSFGSETLSYTKCSESKEMSLAVPPLRTFNFYKFISLKSLRGQCSTFDYVFLCYVFDCLHKHQVQQATGSFCRLTTGKSRGVCLGYEFLLPTSCFWKEATLCKMVHAVTTTQTPVIPRWGEVLGTMSVPRDGLLANCLMVLII